MFAELQLKKFSRKLIMTLENDIEGSKSSVKVLLRHPNSGIYIDPQNSNVIITTSFFAVYNFFVFSKAELARILIWNI